MAERKGELANFQARKRKLNIWKVAVLVILLLVTIYFVVSAVKIFNLNQEKAKIEAENQELKETVEDLKLQQETINSDQYMEGLARRQLRLVKENEILFVLPEIRANEGEDTIFKGSTERAAEEAEANRKIQEAMAAQNENEGGESDEAAAEGDGSEEGSSESSDSGDGQGEGNG